MTLTPPEQIAAAPVNDFSYVWTWRHRTHRPADYPCLARDVKAPWFGDDIDRTGQPCRVLGRRGTMNSALVEFDDGYQVVTSRGGLRKR